MNEGTAGTGQYEGLVWDGKHWVGSDGQQVTVAGGVAQPITAEAAILKGIGFGIIAVLFAIGIQSSILLLGSNTGALPAFFCAGCAAVFGVISLMKVSRR